MSKIDITRLSPAEKFELISELRDSLEDADIPMTPAQIEELDRRLASADADIEQGQTWEEVEARLRARLRP